MNGSTIGKNNWPMVFAFLLLNHQSVGSKKFSIMFTDMARYLLEICWL